jgi:hypothetical protein
MRRINAAVAAVALALTLCVAAAAKADFSGTWVLDKADSEGLPADMDQTMTVTQAGDRLTLETKLITGQGEQVVPDAYTLDGKEKEFTPRAGNGAEGKGRRTARWAADGSGFEVSEEATFDAPEGAVTVKTTRKWSLSADGKTLKIELATEDPNGTHRSKRTFLKK